MASTDLRDLLERAQAWPEEAQAELVAIAKEIESEFLAGEYSPTQEELRIIDAATTSVELGEVVSDVEVQAALTKFRRRSRG